MLHPKEFLVPAKTVAIGPTLFYRNRQRAQTLRRDILANRRNRNRSKDTNPSRVLALLAAAEPFENRLESP